MIVRALGYAVLAALVGPPVLFAQNIPDTFKNLQVLEKNISKADLKATMEGFADQLGVKCTHCHILDQYDKDDRPPKKDARKMIQLVVYMRANLGKYFKADVKPDQIRCWTCHRGKEEPEEYVP